MVEIYESAYLYTHPLIFILLSYIKHLYKIIKYKYLLVGYKNSNIYFNGTITTILTIINWIIFYIKIFGFHIIY